MSYQPFLLISIKKKSTPENFNPTKSRASRGGRTAYKGPGSRFLHHDCRRSVIKRIPICSQSLWVFSCGLFMGYTCYSRRISIHYLSHLPERDLFRLFFLYRPRPGEAFDVLTLLTRSLIHSSRRRLSDNIYSHLHHIFPHISIASRLLAFQTWGQSYQTSEWRS